MQVHNPNPNHNSKGRFTTAGERKPDRLHRGKFGKRIKFNDKPDDVSPSEAYINSALGSSLGHSYSISSSYRLGGWKLGLGDN